MEQDYELWLQEKVEKSIESADNGELFTWEEAINQIRKNYQDSQDQKQSA